MAKKGQLTIILFFFLNAVLHFPSYSQDHKYFIITGKIISVSDNSLNGSVELIKKNKPALISEIPGHGRFRFELEYNAEYQLTFNKEGHQPKTITINTEIPQEVMHRSSNFPHFLMAVKLFKDSQDAANLYPGNQKQQITYSPQQDCFARVPTLFDLEYAEKGNPKPNKAIQTQVNKTKMQVYQVF